MMSRNSKGDLLEMQIPIKSGMQDHCSGCAEVLNWTCFFLHNPVQNSKNGVLVIHSTKLK